MTDISQIYVGAQITLPSSAALGLEARTWVIDEEVYDNRIDDVHEHMSSPSPGTMPSGWKAKYLCHDLHNPQTEAFMRVFSQGPDEGTERFPPHMRAQQADPSVEHYEAQARKAFQQGGCRSVPPLLGWGQSVQGEYGPVPGGYITHLVWEKVPGEILSPEFFWSLSQSRRDLIRDKFRIAYQEILSFGWVPGGQHIGKIIWNEESTDLWISGFHGSLRTDRQLSNDVLAHFELIKPPPRGPCDPLLHPRGSWDKWKW
ncbi:unnamed protein product [Penicillium salamii]|uniref:Uncharacterized protein n=1 Tax=Penicillium salamii TaxID=1612424 RepID=A0A9W4NTT9_9EURO|nr:unnamed protein product [Penicillium salamii]CAG8301906.1 unnamed protein product [Penicillium salamii]CAG8354342.1 unnamed protein product [Penicillium salamii]CAG8360069.1 unnamed protein product [Penicillium salamii]CAG8367520.1 unnamed protein product [Penicillium salamii]